MFSTDKTVLAASNLFHKFVSFVQSIPAKNILFTQCNAIEIQFKIQNREIKLYIKIRHLQILFKCVVPYNSLFAVLARNFFFFIVSSCGGSKYFVYLVHRSYVINFTQVFISLVLDKIRM